jgi:hypothetical protein
MDDLNEYLDFLMNKKNKEFDWFTPFQSVDMNSFVFKPSRYEIWEDGKIISSDQFAGSIYASISKTISGSVQIHISDNSLNRFILQDFKFSICFTQKDRIQLAEIPPEKPTDCNGIGMLRMVTGVTCKEKYFSENEPYCSGLFLIDGELKKITFSFNSPVRLIEFYE